MQYRGPNDGAKYEFYGNYIHIGVIQGSSGYRPSSGKDHGQGPTSIGDTLYYSDVRKLEPQSQ